MNPKDTLPHLNILIKFVNSETSKLNTVNYKHIRGFNHPTLKELLIPNSDRPINLNALINLSAELTTSMSVIDKITTATDLVDILTEENKLLKTLDNAVRNIFSVNVSIDENATLF